MQSNETRNLSYQIYWQIFTPYFLQNRARLNLVTLWQDKQMYQSFCNNVWHFVLHFSFFFFFLTTMYNVYLIMWWLIIFSKTMPNQFVSISTYLETKDFRFYNLKMKMTLQRELSSLQGFFAFLDWFILNNISIHTNSDWEMLPILSFLLLAFVGQAGLQELQNVFSFVFIARKTGPCIYWIWRFTYLKQCLDHL